MNVQNENRGDEAARLANIVFVSIAQTLQRKIGEFILDPDIPLPVELPAGTTSMDLGDLSWEAVVAGTLKVLAWDAGNAHAGYYRRFVLAVKPDISNELIETVSSAVRLAVSLRLTLAAGAAAYSLASNGRSPFAAPVGGL